MSDPSEAARRHAVIAGAGIGGLTLALHLAKTGWTVTLCEREPVMQEVGAGLQLSPNATRLLSALGLTDALNGPAVRPERLVIRRGSDAKILSSIRLGVMAEGRYGAPFLSIHRGELHRILLDAAQNDPAIALRTACRLTDLRMGDTGVEARLTTPDGDQRLPADLLVGADGLWSRARQLAGLPSPSLTSGKSAWRTLVPREAAPIFAREAEANLWMAPQAHLVHYPVCGGEMINIVAITEDVWREEGWNAPGDPDLIRQRFAGWSAEARAVIAAGECWNRWALLDRAPESRWSRGAMTLLGDAAHPMLPFLAQGASQAIEDAAALAAALSTAYAHQSIASALRRYEADRIRRTARIQQASRQQGRIYHLSGLMADARDLAMRLAPDDMPLRRFDWIYTHDAGVAKA